MIEKNDYNDIFFYNLEGKKVFLKDLDNTILYFFPKSFTPGCTLEGKLFNEFYNKFKKEKYNIIGVSCDEIEVLKKFKTKLNLKFEFFKADCEVLEKLNVYKEKTVFGKKKKGIVRTTFIIKKGKIIKKFEKVKVKTHIEEVYQFITNL